MQVAAGSVTPRHNLHQVITQRLIAAMETGPGQFVMPWRQGSQRLPSNALTGNQYNGINILSLWVAAQQAGFDHQLWGTYRQWAALGAQVAAGEHGTLVVFYRAFDVETEEDDGDPGKRFVAKASFVFNADQVLGFEMPPIAPKLGPIERLDRAEQFVLATGAVVSSGGERAYYLRSSDRIQMPAEDLFIGTTTMDRQEAYYATLVHELVHWTGAKHRLDRDLSGRFGTSSYAAEELIAEIGAAFLCSEMGITQDVRQDHAQYLASWARLLASDNRAIFTAAARASTATHYLHSFQGLPPGIGSLNQSASTSRQK